MASITREGSELVADGVDPALTSGISIRNQASTVRAERSAAGQASRAGFVAIIGVSAILVLSRQAYVFARPQFIWEETGGYWLPTFTSGLASLFETWPVGYLTIPSRLAFLIARLGSPETAPIVTLALHGLVVGAVAAFIASSRLESAIPDRPIRFAFALSLALLPVWEPFMSVLSMQWFLALFLVAMSLTRDRRWWDYPAVALSVLSGIGPVLTLPLFWRDRRGAILLILGATQVGLLESSGRGFTGFDPIVLVSRAGVIGGLALLLAAVLIRTLPLRTVVSFAYLAGASAVGGAFVAGSGLLEPASNGRFFLATAALVTLLAITGVRQRKLAALPLAGGLLGWSMLSFFLPASPDTQWVANAHCIGGPVACTVPGWPPEWTVEWRP